MEDPFQQRSSKPNTTTSTMLPVPPFSLPTAAPSTFSPTSTHGGDAEGAGLGGYPNYYHDDATLLAAMQQQQGHQGQQPPLPPPLEMPPYDYPASALQDDLLRLVGVLEAENRLLEALALGRLQRQNEQEQEVASTIADMRDARSLLEAYEAERQRLEARMDELGGKASAARARAAAAEASVGGRTAALETQVRALELRLRGGAVANVEAAVAAAREAWEKEAEALVARVMLVKGTGATEGGDAGDVADVAAEKEEEDGEPPAPNVNAAEEGDWRARLESMAAGRRREEGRLRRRLLSTFRALVAEREARARVEGEVHVVKARLVGMEEDFRSRVLGGPLGVEEAERQRDAARVELAAARAAADSANTRVGVLEAEVKALRAAAASTSASAAGGGAGAGREGRARALEEENAGLKAAVATAKERAAWLEAELVRAREQQQQQQQQPPQQEGQGAGAGARAGGATPAVAAASPFAGAAAGRKRLDAAFAGVEVEWGEETTALQPSSRVAWLLAQRSPSTAADSDRLRRLAGEVSDVLRIAGRAAAAEAEREREAMLRGQVTELEKVKEEGERALAATRGVVASHGRALLRAQAAGVVVACWCRWRRRRREGEGPVVSLGEAFRRWRRGAVVMDRQEEEAVVEPAAPSPLLPSWEGGGGGGVEESKGPHQRKSPRPPSV